MLALADAFKNVQFGGMLEETEARELGLDLERYYEVKQAYHDTYLVVDTLEYGYKLPKNPRKGWKNCGNY
jgi:hypothetical protein